MTIKSAYSGAVTIVAIGLLIALLMERHASTELRVAISRAHFRSEADSARIAELERRAQQKEADTAHSKQLSAESQKKEPPETLDDYAFDRIVANSPELQELYIKQQTLQYAQKFGLLYASLGLSPDEIVQFESIMAEDFQSVIDLSVAVVSKGYRKDDPAAKRIRTDARESRDRKLRDLLGESGLRELEAYEKNDAGKGLTDMLARNLYYTDSPMDRGTAVKFSKAVSNVLERNGGQIDWDQLTKEASNIMTPGQVAVLKQHVAAIDNGANVVRTLKKVSVDLSKLSDH